MKLIISPAKKMRSDVDTLPWKDMPCFLEKAETLYRKMQSMTKEELKELWRCSDAIAAQNWQRLHTSDLHTGLTPAILAYEGIQYQYMAPGVMTQRELDYLQDHLCILSGLYGLLRPFDGVIPYRLEMQARLSVCKAKNLYEYWDRTISDCLWQETSCVVNLASREYSACVSRHPKPGTRLITCVFHTMQNGKMVEKGTLCKMARGEMVRFLAQREAAEPEVLRDFSGLGFSFDSSRSDESTYVFCKE